MVKRSSATYVLSTVLGFVASTSSHAAGSGSTLVAALTGLEVGYAIKEGR